MAGNLERRLRNLEQGPEQQREPVSIAALWEIAEHGVDPDRPRYYVPVDALEWWREYFPEITEALPVGPPSGRPRRRA